MRQEQKLSWNRPIFENLSSFETRGGKAQSEPGEGCHVAAPGNDHQVTVASPCPTVHPFHDFNAS